MKLVGYKDSNGIELADSQHIKIYDKTESKFVVDGVINYLPGAFMINNNDGNNYLLFWYIRDYMSEYDSISNKERYIIEVTE